LLSHQKLSHFITVSDTRDMKKEGLHIYFCFHVLPLDEEPVLLAPAIEQG
jgi:hypothetical protein